MNRKKLTTIFFAAIAILLNQSLFAINTKDTRMLSQPAISNNHIAFIYAEDLWIADIDGSNPKRLTIDEGVESRPCFSPDGKHIAFNAEYDGNSDIFILPIEGGIPKRLTWHPGADFVRGFSPDGKKIIFASWRESFTGAHPKLFTVPVEGGFPEKLIIPNGWRASYSPDGKKLAYNPLIEAHTQWKNYRGGTNSEIWVFDFNDYSTIEVPQPDNHCNDSDPIWLGNKIYFRSDRNGEFNLFSYDASSNEIEQLTDFNDFPVNALSGSNNKIVYEQAGYIHVYDIQKKTSEKVIIGIAADLLELRERYVKANYHLRSYDISPSGARAVFDARGEILTVPAEKGDILNITNTSGAHEKYPAWSPDGKNIAYFSDESGEYQLYIKSKDGKGEAKSFKIKGNGFYAYPNWSPDSKKISFVDNGRVLYVLDIESGKTDKIDEDDLYVPRPFRNLFGDWSFDSKWILYTKITETNFRVVYLYSLDEKKSYQLTDGYSNATEPVFDPSGKYIYFFASTDAGPVVNWFDQSNIDMEMNNSIYLVTLKKDIISPLAKENDDEEIKEDSENGEDKKEKEEDKKDKEQTLVIDFEGIQNRIIDLPIKAGKYSHLNSGAEGQIYYIDNEGDSKLHKYDLKEKNDKEIMPLDSYRISVNKKKMIYRKGSTFGITNIGEKPKPGKGILNSKDFLVKMNPIEEWTQIFDEAWRINRDYFYDPGMHGADWEAMKIKYKQFLPDLTCRSDLNILIRWMCSELGVGHHRVYGGENLGKPEKINGGLLGADYEIENNLYKIKKIYGGLNWNPKLRSPLTEPGINAKEGDYIIAVNGQEVTADKNLFSFFENTSGKIVELTINSKPSTEDARVVNVVPVNSEYSLRNRDWVEGNLKRVNEATNGQVAYVYVPNTAGLGHEYFKRYFYPQANKKAIIIDERFNGGGLLADYYINLLTQPYQSYWNFRYGKDLKTPSASIQGPKVMLINENAGSGGDMLPFMFRKFNVGKMVGKRTWGGLVGVLGFPEFIDGGGVTAPNVAIWTKDGFIVENVGVAPDIEIDQTPSEVIKGKDPQLEKAIEVVLEELKKNPIEKPQRPDYPVRVRK